MANLRNEDKTIRKDQQGPREVREEVAEEIRARGDWDRTGDHHDEGTSRSDDVA